MRLQSKIKVPAGDKMIGGSALLICLPLVARDKSDLLTQALELKQLSPDLLEWRIDGYDAVEDKQSCIDALQELLATVGPIPLIFTCRIHSEGGMKEIAQEARLELITASIAAGGVDLVDIELCNEPPFIETVKKAAHDNGSKLVLSYHNFEATPDEDALHEKLLQAQAMGADIAKLAVMPKNYADVLTLLGATLKARTGALKIPIVTTSMGPEGGVTRLVGGLFGSDITFAIGKKSSAPGQVSIGELRQAMAVLYG